MPQPKISKKIGLYYKKWIDSSHPLFSPNDIPKFYRFTKTCVRYGGKRYWSGQRLRRLLEKDLPNKYQDEEYIEQIIREAVSIFDHLLDYERTKLYDYDIEPRLQRERLAATAANKQKHGARK